MTTADLSYFQCCFIWVVLRWSFWFRIKLEGSIAVQAGESKLTGIFEGIFFAFAVLLFCLGGLERLCGKGDSFLKFRKDLERIALRFMHQGSHHQGFEGNLESRHWRPPAVFWTSCWGRCCDALQLLY